MTVRPYPSNTIILHIDERLMSKELKLALERSWAHVADTIIRTHSAPQATDPYNFIHVFVKYGTRRYLLSESSEDADANWNERMEKHIFNTIAKVGNNTKIYNRRQRKGGQKETSFEYLEIALESGALVLEFRLDSNSDLPLECAHIASHIRTIFNRGSFGENLRRVIIPSPESYRQQKAAFLDATAQREAEKAAADEAARLAAQEAREAAESDAEEQFLESPELLREFEEKQKKEGEQEAVVVEPLTASEWEAEYGFDDPDFEIDYHLWELIYEDGSSRGFNSLEESFIL
jgi:hypothetical protein